MRRCRHEHGKVSTLADHENAWIESGTDVERLVFFSDAVFAIAITLLASEIRLPEIHKPTTRELRSALLDLLPQVYSFAISFWIIGVLAGPPSHLPLHQGLRPEAHGHQPLVPDVDSAHTVLGVAAGWVRFVPARGGGLLFAHDRNQPQHALLWWYATSDRKLIDPDIDPALIGYNYLRISTLPAVFVLAIGISFFSTAAGYSVLLLFFVRPIINLYARRRLS
jgi:hypothetical protein